MRFGTDDPDVEILPEPKLFAFGIALIWVGWLGLFAHPIRPAVGHIGGVLVTGINVTGCTLLGCDPPTTTTANVFGSTLLVIIGTLLVGMEYIGLREARRRGL